MRGTVDGLPSPYMFGALLPAVYQEDPFAQRWMSAFDDVLAPIVSVIDNVESYFDSWTAPLDFVQYLAAWVGIELDETWSDTSQRELVARAAALYKIRGTVAGLKDHIAIYTGSEPEIEESGGCIWSQTANTDLPGDDRAHLTVRVTLPEDSPVDERRLDHLVGESKPAHLPHRVEITRE